MQRFDSVRGHHFVVLRACPSGQVPASQAAYAGSSPAARSTLPIKFKRTNTPLVSARLRVRGPGSAPPWGCSSAWESAAPATPRPGVRAPSSPPLHGVVAQFGRALRWHRRGHGFEPRPLHHFTRGSSAAERLVHTQRAGGSSPSRATTYVLLRNRLEWHQHGFIPRRPLFNSGFRNHMPE